MRKFNWDIVNTLVYFEHVKKSSPQYETGGDKVYQREVYSSNTNKFLPKFLVNMIPKNVENCDIAETITTRWDDYPVLSGQQLKINTETDMRNNSKSDLKKIMSHIVDCKNYTIDDVD